VLASDRDKVMRRDCFEHTAVDISEQLPLERLNYAGANLGLGRLGSCLGR